MKIHNNPHSRGFALVATVSMMVLLTLVAIAMLSLSTIEQRSSGGGSNEADRMARANARMALMIALGELQKAAGPDQRVSATASILGSSSNPHANGTNTVDGRKHWAGVWDTSNYNPAIADSKTFVRWLVSGHGATTPDVDLEDMDEADDAPGADDVVIFEGADAASTVKVPKVEVATATPGNSSYYAYWVEDEGVKVDLAWNEGDFSDTDRQQAARLSTAPGPDHAVFEGPFSSGVSYPLEKGSGYVDDLEKAFSSADMPLVMGSTVNHSDWLKANRHNMAMNVRGVIADVKKGGLRRDLSLAFEMDGSAESENATIFNQQTTEFVGNGDQLSSPYNMPGMSLKARHLFRDYGPQVEENDPADASDDEILPSAGNFFSADITQPATVVRGPSWWLLRDYANLYKRLKTSVINDDAGDFLYNTHKLAARPYFPNRTTPVDPTTTLIQPTDATFAEDLSDIHSDNQWMAWKYEPIKGPSVNRETNYAGTNYAYRPVRAPYAPVLLGVNAIYSLVYSDNQLKMVVDPFFIVWNPYNTQITADKFAITLEYGLAGGMRFRHTDPNGIEKYYGRPSGWGNYGGSDTYFIDFAKRKSGADGHVTYLLDDLDMEPGEVMIYSPPSDAVRGSNANVLHDELNQGINYNATDSGIFFTEFPEYNINRGFLGWKTITLQSTVDTDGDGTPDAPDPQNHKIDVLFNIASQGGPAIVNIIETNIPPAESDPERPYPEDLTTEESYGDNVSAQEYRLNLGGGQYGTNLDVGQRWTAKSISKPWRNWVADFGVSDIGEQNWPLSYNIGELEQKRAFGLLSMLTLSTDITADTKMEPFSQLNATPILRTQLERFSRAPLNIAVKVINTDNINNQLNQAGIDIAAYGDGGNGFYGKSYTLADGDSKFPLIDIPKAPLHSLVQLSGANIGTRLFEPTHAIGNSWKPPYIPWDSVYVENASLRGNSTVNDVSWQANDALFDRYFLSGIAPGFAIGAGGYDLTSIPGNVDPDPSYLPHVSDCIEDILKRFYSVAPYDTSPDPSSAKANPVLEPHVPAGKTSDDVVADLNPNDTQYNTTTNIYDGYKKIGAYSLIKGAFNVNSTSVKAWSAFLKGNKALALESVQGTTESGTGTPFPLSSTTSAEINPKDPLNGPQDEEKWEELSRLSDSQIDLLAEKIVDQIKARGPFMSISDFVNRRIGAKTDLRSYHGAIQEAIEQSGINGIYDTDTNTFTGLRGTTSETIPNYANHVSLFPYADDDSNSDNINNYIGDRNNATGIPLEVNQANILLPLAPRLSARSDTFRIRAYGEVRDADDKIIAQATCEAVVQRLPEYVDPDTDDPWDDDSETPTLNAINQTYGRKFEIQSFRWLDQSEV